MIKQFKSLQDEIQKMLTVKDVYRDDDAKLVCGYYFNRLGRSNLETMSGMDFLHLLANGSIPMPDNITRVRRKLQEKHPELRGKEWGKRHTVAEDVRQNIRNV